MTNDLTKITGALFKSDDNDEAKYQRFAEESALFLTNLMSQKMGQPLKFNGYSRGPNIFIETADAATTRWAAINNPLLGNGYAVIRRSCYGSYDFEQKTYKLDPQPSYEIRGFILPDQLTRPTQPGWLVAPTTFLKVSPAAIKELVDNGELWVGNHPWAINEDSKNTDEFTDCQKDFDWVNDPFVQKNYPLIVKIAQINKDNLSLLTNKPTDLQV